jgi:DNA gyrase subunit B
MAKEQTQNKDSYTAKDIYVLEGLEPVRRRPAMYIGSTGIDGLHHLIWEVVDNSIDEAMAGYAKNVSIVLLPDNQVRVVDDGRGIPVEIHKQTKKSALETVMTTLHAGAKFGGESYKIAGGLHGVGVSVVNALSKRMKVDICREGIQYSQEYERGKAVTKVKKAGSCEGSGTAVTFIPDREIFKEINFHWDRILDHLRQQAYLMKGLKIAISDQREREPLLHRFYAFYFEGGLRSYIGYLNSGLLPKHSNVFYILKEADKILVEISFQYVEDFQSREASFANNIYTQEGGTHLTGFRTALTRILNDYARKNGYLKESEENLTGDDVREGLTAIVSVKIREPQFEGQTKAKLGNPEARSAVDSVFSEAFPRFLEEHPQDARQILEKVILALNARKAAKAAKDSVFRKGVFEGFTLPGKLADCQSKDPQESELFIVEGESAGGCFSGDTEIALADGRNITFEKLIEEHKKGKRNYCYTIGKNGNIEISLIENPRITKSHVDAIKIILDNNKEIICTPDHKFMLRNGSYKEAKDLKPKDSLMPLHRQRSRLGKRITIKDYELVFNPKENRWIFTHLLADDYNFKNSIYTKEKGDVIHHLDFNKLNNNPENLIRMPKIEHLIYHTEFLAKTLHREDVKEKARRAHQSDEYRRKIREIMTRPRMRKILSERAKKQWESEEYKNFMTKKFFNFYNRNAGYRQKHNELLNKNQKKYWGIKENRERQADRVREFFERHPETRKWLSEIAKKQWADLNLREWRSKMTKKQWTSEFREKRKKTYNQTYLRKALEILSDAYQKNKTINQQIYNHIRGSRNDKTLLKYETVCQRFFDGDEKRLKAAVLNYNHRIKRIIPLGENIDVYDIEVHGTHNFALASGVFVHNSSKQGRDRRTQAVLPLKGKILNVERARLDKMLSSEEIKGLVTVLGAAIADELNMDKLRYHRIIIATDADVDGSHIRTLLLTLFYRYYRPIIERGYLYIAQPPLYRISPSGRSSAGRQYGPIYAYSDNEKEKIIKEIGKAGANINIQRYKGLGEMNPPQLWETTMDPRRRILKKVTIEDAQEADRTFDTLMGKEVAPRRLFIETHAKAVQNLDI